MCVPNQCLRSKKFLLPWIGARVLVYMFEPIEPENKQANRNIFLIFIAADLCFG